MVLAVIIGNNCDPISLLIMQIQQERILHGGSDQPLAGSQSESLDVSLTLCEFTVEPANIHQSILSE